MAWTPMAPEERASIESQVILKEGVEGQQLGVVLPDRGAHDHRRGARHRGSLSRAAQ